MDGSGSLFEFLFKYRPVIFERGDFTFSAPWPAYLVAVLVVVAAVPTFLLYTKARGRSRALDRIVLTGVRSTVLALVLFSLFRPVLVLSSVVPQRNFVGVLIDDSRSMRIEDVDRSARGAFSRDAFNAETGSLLHGLAERFIVRMYRFGSDVRRVEDAGLLTFAQGKTDLGQALDVAREELASVPLAGLVVITDGADNSGESLAEPLLALQARGIPVHTVGLGQETFSRDVQLTRVQTPRRVLNGTSLVVDVMVSQRGYRGQVVPLIVEDEGRIVNTHDVELGGDGEAVAVRVHFTVTEAGPRVFKFRIPEQPGEMVAQNNEQEVLILVEDRRERILYFEGEPRPELKFIRRAVDEDENLHLVALIRTAENKFLRLGVADEDELVSGFPRTREELFEYRGLIIGSVEASFFTHDQLRMIADFVSQRGGGLLMLGGRRSFVEGGYGDTPIEDVLPVVLDGSPSDDFFAEVQVEPTPAGRGHPATQIAATEDGSAERWRELPAVTVLNRLTEVKAGATTLLRGGGGAISSPQVVLATQRYGRGKALALTIQDSWTWQMHADIPLEDQTHETFWRQLLRNLVSFVPERVGVQAPDDRTAPNEPVTLTATVEDETYLKVNNTDVVASITSPSGHESTAPMEWTVERDGEYQTTFVPQEEGLYAIRVDARQNDEFLASSVTYLHSTELAREYYAAEMQATTLRRLADETGGAFYTPATVSTLPDDIRYTESGTTVIEENDLWDMPVIFMMILGLMSLEWGYRRFRGLV